MKRYPATLLLLLLANAAIADEPTNPAAKEPRRFSGILGVGYTYGGDTLPDVELVGGGVSTLRSGTGILASGGGMWHITPRLALQGTFGYHFHAASHDGGTAYVIRYPLEISPFLYLGEKVRIGAGWRHGFKLKYDGRYNKSPSIEFKQSNGLVFEAGYQFQPEVWVNLRYVRETFRAQPFDFQEKQYEMGPIDASHFGLIATHTF